MAARLGYVFGQDPVALLRDGDEIAWMVRAAAWEVYARDEKARAKAGSSGGPRRRH